MYFSYSSEYEILEIMMRFLSKPISIGAVTELEFEKFKNQLEILFNKGELI